MALHIQSTGNRAEPLSSRTDPEVHLAYSQTTLAIGNKTVVRTRL
jgi:hypothetical protein